jgi:hypothetical protein
VFSALTVTLSTLYWLLGGESQTSFIPAGWCRCPTGIWVTFEDILAILVALLSFQWFLVLFQQRAKRRKARSKLRLRLNNIFYSYSPREWSVIDGPFSIFQFSG